MLTLLPRSIYNAEKMGRSGSLYLPVNYNQGFASLGHVTKTIM